MKVHIPFIAFVLGCGQAFGQDTLYFRNGKKDVVKINQVNPREIRYHFKGEKDGPEIVLSRNEVSKIAFEGGQVMDIKPEVFQDHSMRAERSRLKRLPLENFYRNNVWISLSEIFLFRGGFTYERILGEKGKFAIRVPLSFSLKDKRATFSHYGYADDYNGRGLSNSDYSMNGLYYDLQIPNVFNSSRSGMFPTIGLASAPIYLNFGRSVHTGIGGRFYAGGQKRKNFFVGVELQGGVFNYQLITTQNDYPTNGSGNYYSTTETKNKTGGMVAGFVEIGGRFNSASDRVSFSISLGLGARRFIDAPNARFYGQVPFPNLTINPQLALSYNFVKKK
jgi:hypothetical protein